MSTSTGLILIVHELDTGTDGLSSFLVDIDKLKRIEEELSDDAPRLGECIKKAWDSQSKVATISYEQRISYNRCIWPCLIQMTQKAGRKIGINGCVILYVG